MENHSKNTVSLSTGTLIRGVLVVISLILIYVLRDIVLIVLTSIVIASFIESAAGKLSKFKIPRMLSVVCVYLVSLSILAGVFYLLLPVLLSESARFADFISQYLPQAKLFQSDALSGAKQFVDNLSNTVSLTDFATTAQKFATAISGGFLQSLSVLFGGIVNVVLIIVISFYLSIQERGIENFLRIVIPLKHEDYAVDLWQRSQRKIALWVKGQLVLGLIIGVLTYMGLALFSVQYALLIALMTALAEIVPFGLVLISVPAIAIAYANDGASTGIIVALFYLILHEFEVYLLQPLVIKKVVGISPLMVVLSLLVGFTLAGFWGVVLAVPVAVALLEFMNDVEKRKIFSKSQA